MVLKKPSVTEPKIKETKENRSQDSMLLHIASYLVSCTGNTAMQPDIESYFHRVPWTVNFNQVREALLIMQSAHWVESEQRGSKKRMYTWYTLTDDGRLAFKEAKDLVNSNSKLKCLKAFKNFPIEPIEDSFA